MGTLKTSLHELHIINNCSNDAEKPTLKIQNPGDRQFTWLTLKMLFKVELHQFNHKTMRYIYIDISKIHPPLKKPKTNRKMSVKIYFKCFPSYLPKSLSNSYRRMAARFSLYSVCIPQKGPCSNFEVNRRGKHFSALNQCGFFTSTRKSP